jgi:hypothetical protein
VVAELELNSVKPPPDTKTKRENKDPVMKNITEKPKSHYSTQSVMITEEPRMEIPRRNGLKNLRLDKSTSSSKLIREHLRIKEP